MSKKIVMLMIFAVLLGVALTACERPASTAPAATATGGGIPFPVTQATTTFGTLATQTAIAKNQQPTAVNGQPVENPTPVPDQPTAVPAEGATSQPPAPRGSHGDSPPANRGAHGYPWTPLQLHNPKGRSLYLHRTPV